MVRSASARGIPFKQLAQLERFLDESRRELGDHHPAAGSPCDKSLHFEPAQGVAHRRATDTDPLGKLRLAKRRAGCEGTVEDGLSQHLVRVVGKSRPADDRPRRSEVAH
jgi:hypothetical protein